MQDGDCDSCVFAIPKIHESGELLLKCRRFPPQIYVDGDGDVCQIFPEATARCGEYKEEDLSSLPPRAADLRPFVEEQNVVPLRIIDTDGQHRDSLYG